jgi:2,3-bisphosphoglycerate-independent phosphoglycerate mutase
MNKTKHHILFIFLDGVGIGKKSDLINPFFSASLPAFKAIGGGAIPALRDAHHVSTHSSSTSLNVTLGVSGLPQSGTGQAALMTGTNVSRVIGKHFGPYLYSSLKPIVSRYNLFRRLREMGKQPYYANAYPRQYFDYIATHRRVTVIPFAWVESGYQLNDHSAVRTGRALSADITNVRWHRLGYPDLQVITPTEAGKRLGHLTQMYDFVLFEYFDTDHAGHHQDMKEAVEVLEKVDGMIHGVLDTVDPAQTTILITSDHGNIEDLSTKSHTRNPVPLFAFGKQHRTFTQNAKIITELTPLILEYMK